MASVTYTSPVPSGTVTSTVGPRNAPTAGASSDHKGTDFSAPRGTDVFSSAPGTVVGVYPNGSLRGYGNAVEIEHADGTSTFYAHLDSYGVKEGDRVGTDAPIGKLGNTGVGTGPHLHYERYDSDTAELRAPFGDNDKLNSAAGSKGSKVSKNGETQPAPDGDNKDGKKGNQDGNTDTKDDNEKRAKSQKPVDQKEHKDIKGTTGNYRQETTKSISSRLPTHEPWPGHPKSTEGPRQALQGKEDGGNGNGGSGNGGSGGSGSNGGSGGRGTSTNPGGGGEGGSGNNNYTNYGQMGAVDDKQQAGGERVYDRLRAKGWSDAAATAAVGNFMGEGLNGLGKYGEGIHNDPDPKGNPGLSRGIAQWRKERGVDLENFANRGGYPGGWKNLDAQADFFDYEMKRDYAPLYNSIKTSNDQGYVTGRLVNEYERPRQDLRPKAIQERIANGNTFKKKKAKKPPTADPGMNKKDAEQKPGPATGAGNGSGGSGGGGGGASTSPGDTTRTPTS